MKFDLYRNIIGGIWGSSLYALESLLTNLLLVLVCVILGVGIWLLYAFWK